MDRLSGSAIYIGNFLRAIGVYLPYLVASTFLSRFILEKSVGLVFTAASLIAGMIILSAPRFFTRFRTHRTLIGAAVLAAIALIGLSLAHTALVAIVLFIVAWNASWVVALALDVILEKITGAREMSTGSSRSFFLTASNIAVVLASFIISVTLTDGDYWRVFLIAAGAFVLCAYLAVRFFAVIPHVPAKTTKVRDALAVLTKQRTFSAVMGVHFLLQLLFVWSSVYIPLYLYNHAKFSWESIGALYGFATLAFVLIEIPIGKLFDGRFREKDFMVAGLVVSGAAFIALSSGATAGFFLLAGLVFLTQMGGAFLEISSETYFFKRVNASDSELIGMFRLLRQMATIVGPLVGSVALFFVPFEYAFAIFGVILLLGVPLSLSIKDAR